MGGCAVFAKEAKKNPSLKRRVFRWIARLFVAVVMIGVIAFLIVFREPLWRRFYTFPRQAAAWESIRAQRQPVALDDGWDEYRGACHSHSELSHDSEVTFPEVAAACKQAGIDFIFMSDHCVDGKADYSLGWRDEHDGIIFVRGYEMSAGFMPWGLPDDTVLDCGGEPKQLAAEIAAKGGMLFFAHSEEERLWDLPELVGMEIYNIHTDFKDEGFDELLPDILFSIRAYPDQMLRLVFDRQTDILAHWDELNQTRKIVGISANDCHQNNGYRGFYTEKGTFLLRELSGDDAGEYQLNFFTRFLLRAAFGPLEPGKELFTFMVDPYERMLRFSNDHLLVHEKSYDAFLDALRNGRCFMAFDMIADARGFTYVVEDGPQKAVMGQSVPFRPGMQVRAESPLPCRFILVRDGKRVAEQTGRTFTFDLSQPGNYRIEAELDVLGEWTPWVYTNPIYVEEPPTQPASQFPQESGVTA